MHLFLLQIDWLYCERFSIQKDCLYCTLIWLQIDCLYWELILKQIDFLYGALFFPAKILRWRKRRRIIVSVCVCVSVLSRVVNRVTQVWAVWPGPRRATFGDLLWVILDMNIKYHKICIHETAVVVNFWFSQPNKIVNKCLTYLDDDDLLVSSIFYWTISILPYVFFLIPRKLTAYMLEW